MEQKNAYPIHVFVTLCSKKPDADCADAHFKREDKPYHDDMIYIRLMFVWWCMQIIGQLKLSKPGFDE